MLIYNPRRNILEPGSGFAAAAAARLDAVRLSGIQDERGQNKAELDCSYFVVYWKNCLLSKLQIPYNNLLCGCKLVQ